MLLNVQHCALHITVVAGCAKCFYAMVNNLGCLPAAWPAKQPCAAPILISVNWVLAPWANCYLATLLLSAALCTSSNCHAHNYQCKPSSKQSQYNCFGRDAHVFKKTIWEF